MEGSWRRNMGTEPEGMYINCLRSVAAVHPIMLRTFRHFDASVVLTTKETTTVEIRWLCRMNTIQYSSRSGQVSMHKLFISCIR